MIQQRNIYNHPNHKSNFQKLNQIYFMPKIKKYLSIINCELKTSMI